MPENFFKFFISEFPLELVTRFLVFFVPTTLIYLTTTKWLKNYFAGRKIQKKNFLESKVKHDIIWSAINRFLLTFVTIAIAWAVAGNYSLIYTDINKFGGAWYLVFSLILVFLIHDTYFYFFHRMMHSRLLMKHVHRLHHNSTDPTPFTGYAFHPWETVIEFAFLPLIIFIIPLHPIVFAIWQFGGILLFSMYAHLGFEIMPKWWVTNPVTKYFNTPTNHNMHHAKFNYNYGLYFNFWDRIFKTHHVDYEKTFLEVLAPVASKDK
jgi:Delta7-sterol 5-desaturase